MFERSYQNHRKKGGFRSGRSIIDTVFCSRQLQEKCTEQNMPLYVVLVDFSKILELVFGKFF